MCFRCVHLCAISCNCKAGKQSFPVVILSFHSERDDGIHAGLILKSVCTTTTHTEHYTPRHTHSHTHKFPTLIWSNMHFCWFSCLAIFILHKLFQTVICLIQELVLVPRSLPDSACNESAWHQITQNTLCGPLRCWRFSDDLSWRWFAFMPACYEMWPSWLSSPAAMFHKW